MSISQNGWQKIDSFVSVLLEELFPWLAFFKNQRKLLKITNDPNIIARNAKIYECLGTECLNQRIAEEHERAIRIDEKTSKFTLGLSIFLAVLATASGTFARFLLSDDKGVEIISMLCFIASIYMLSAGIVALGAFKTLPTYGYGTDHLLKQKDIRDVYLAQTLYSQERINIIRQLRNEAAYQSLRNGFVILLLVFIYLALAIAYQQISLLYV